MDRFDRGRVVARRNISRRLGIVGLAYPLIVVQDDDKMFVGYRPPGSPFMLATGKREGPRDHVLREWDGGHRDLSHPNTDAFLEFHRPGDAHSVYLFRRMPDLLPDRWYVNLEEPWRRTALGFDTRDLILDIVIQPDLTTWHWKDEDELALAISSGTMPEDEARGIREEGLRALERLRRRERPYADGWDRWDPDPAWPTRPEFPEGWARYRPADPAPHLAL